MRQQKRQQTLYEHQHRNGKMRPAQAADPQVPQSEQHHQWHEDHQAGQHASGDKQNGWQRIFLQQAASVHQACRTARE